MPDPTIIHGRFRATRDTTANWNLHSEFVPMLGEFIVYTDYKTVTDENENQIQIPGLKIGDGVTPLVDLPFATESLRSELGLLAFEDSLSSSGKFTPEGTVSAPDITVLPSMENDFVAGSATGGGSVSPGTAASCTLPVLTMSVDNEVLTYGWSAGSFTPNEPTSVTLPSFIEKALVNGIASATSTQPTFTGTEGDVSVSGSPTPSP